jgi:hypothetical protein
MKDVTGRKTEIFGKLVDYLVAPIALTKVIPLGVLTLALIGFSLDAVNLCGVSKAGGGPCGVEGLYNPICTKKPKVFRAAPSNLTSWTPSNLISSKR